MNHTLICVSLAAFRVVELLPSMRGAAHHADIFEIRADYFNEAERQVFLNELPALLEHAPRRLIVTLRSREQGGHVFDDEAPPGIDERADFHTRALRLLIPHDGLIDIELDLARHFQMREQSSTMNAAFEWRHVICSHHDFDGGAHIIEAAYHELAATPARVLKLATTARDAIDCLPVIRTLRQATNEGRELIALAMGVAGVMTRILAPLFDSLLTYAAVDDKHATARGQVTAHAMHDLYRTPKLDEDTFITGLIGNTVAHSLSPHIHNRAFTAQSVNAVYLPFETHDLDAFMRRMVHPKTRETAWNLRGLSVTAPHKQNIIPYLDDMDDAAREVGAVNTIVIKGDELHGYNTDARAALVPLEGLIDLYDKRVAVIGAGGACRAVLWSLREAGAHATVYARDTTRAAIAQTYGASCEKLEDANFAAFDVVINTTPLGTRGTPREHETPAVAGQLRGARIVYDLVYNPSETRFMKEARIASCFAVGGLEMLIAQAAAQWTLWTGHDTAPLDVMREAARDELA
ncbi:MAG: shikimate dehydrogenase [Pyrinomonadaceae bacterium MAG19_C2-C3]|nr:shikimate dehydrogenase [Pyrinomonadaceae bacterium MAG19_C2-C3]